MAKKTTETTETAETTPVNAVAAVTVALPDGFVDLGLDRFFYKPESCLAKPLVGFLIGVQEFERDNPDKNKWWDALVVRTTAPTLAVQKNSAGEETLIEVGVGEEVMIAITDKLEKLRDYATHPKLMAEFFIQPIEKLVLETDRNGNPTKTLWRYKAGGKQPVPRVTTAAWGDHQQVAAAPKNGAQLPG